MNLANQRERREIAARGWSWARDVSDAFDGDAPLYIDDCHVTARGNAIVAARIAAALGVPGDRSAP